MMKEIFCSIASLLKDSTLFNPDYCFEYVELVKTSTSASSEHYTVRPKYYNGQNVGYIDVQDWDVGGTFYIRKTGKVNIVPSTTKSLTAYSGDSIIKINIPIKIVAAVPKSRIGDSAFSDDILANRIISILNGNLDVAATINAIETDITVVNYDTDSNNIWSGENKGVDFSESLVKKVSYISLDFVISITAYSSCLTTCENEY